MERFARQPVVWAGGPPSAVAGTRLVVCVAAVSAMLLTATAGAQARAPDAAIDDFFSASALDESVAAPARERLAAAWRDGYAAMLVDEIELMRRTSLVDPRAWVRLNRLAQFLQKQTGQDFGLDIDAWHEWVWSLPYEPHPAYGEFKGRLYGQLDPRFAQFFRAPVHSTIRLDEVQWGGVPVNGIPPLDHPEHITAGQADFMGDDNVVFGITIDGVSRAYPKRILAWHELAGDAIGGRELTIVYCTLCGTVIPYDSRAGGKLRRFGTSGLLYRSNKLMFDEATHSLWSSLSGTPVIGPLADSGLELDFEPVVTTTWGEWRRRHPDTTVLSLNTGYQRDYSEGAAYRQYFSSDALMFDVSKHDLRLPNKAEILALRLENPDGSTEPLAISADFLSRHSVYMVDTVPTLVVVTSRAGANRVYRAGEHRFVGVDEDGRVLDDAGRAWTVAEAALTLASGADTALPRVPAYRAFWFGWYAQHPDTMLIK